MVGNLVAGVLGVCVLGATGAAPGYNFLVLGGGGEPEHNEIALEKNALYFQRTLQVFGVEPESATVYFANGQDGKQSVRYLDEDSNEQFRSPRIPHLKGPSTRASFQEWLDRTLREQPPRPTFLYFTGHGGRNTEDLDNNYLALWDERTLSVRALARALDKLPPGQPVVAVMSQCFAGSFANFIYRGGDPEEPVASQARCGFFATVKERPSVGCTPEADEADYRDYSSSFFAGLSGLNRVGQPVASADYDKDGHMSFAEAHAFAKVDGRTPDWPVSTSEVWLQRKARSSDEADIFAQPVLEMLPHARPEQRHVIESLAARLKFELGESFAQNESQLLKRIKTEEQTAYAVRLWMELVNLGMEARVRREAQPEQLQVLDRLLACERGSWQASPQVASFPAPEQEPEAPSLCGSGALEDGAPHRIATRSNRRTGKDRAPWTLRFEKLFDRADMSLSDPLNLVYLREHASGHPEAYHREVYERLQASLEGCADKDSCQGVLKLALRRLAAELCTPDTALSSLVSW